VDDDDDDANAIRSIRARWELAAALDFLVTFKRTLRVGRRDGEEIDWMTADAIERALVRPVDSKRLLRELHHGLLRGVEGYRAGRGGGKKNGAASKRKKGGDGDDDDDDDASRGWALALARLTTTRWPSLVGEKRAAREPPPFDPPDLDGGGAEWARESALEHYETKITPASRLRRVLLTLVPIRPRSRGERRSLRTFSPGVSRRPSPLAFNPDTPRRLSTPLLTPFNSTPTSL
jgi:hypothetical protein